MVPTITLFYASLLAIWLIILAARVITYRRANLVELGTGDDRTMAFRVRAHGNLTEYAPFALLLMALLEAQGMSAWIMHGLGLLLLAGRLIHGYAFCFANGYMRFRVLGMVLTFAMIGISAVLGLGSAVFQAVN